ncbi:hypothetical protein SAMN05216188_13412 [Lentzea xinjiangensis]|uniref:ATP-grasp domain-containing protein n=1 Tax=Lentzea xinjiangensis TaxID=402600 RepID=A0A1H9WHH1_9PSEU|nr:hypothetical protein SAMN05216188_13412 [Lentzea xinjiangensis]
MSADVRLLLCFPTVSLARKAVRSGVDLRLVVAEDERRSFESLAAGRTDVVDAGDGDAVARTVASVVRNHRITHVLTADGFPATQAVPDAARAAHVLAEDRRLAEVLATSRYPMIRRRTATGADIAETVARIGLPVVIRSGWCDEVVLRRGAELAEWLGGGEPGPVEVEEFVVGPRVVITTVTLDGMHRVVGVTAKWTTGGGVRYLHPAELDEALACEARASAMAVLDLVGYEFGPAETTLVLSDRGPRVVSVRPGFGTRTVTRLIETVSGIDVQTELLRALAGARARPRSASWYAGAEQPRPRAGDAGGASYVVAEGPTPGTVEALLDRARHAGHAPDPRPAPRRPGGTG